MGRMLAFIVGIALAHASAGQTIIRPFAPTDRAECDKAWEQNNETARKLVEDLGKCNIQCADQRWAAYSTSSYHSICGGEVPRGENGHGNFRKCAPIHARLQRFYVQKKEAHDQCVAAVERISAANYVAGHSENDDAAPEPVSSTRQVTSSLRDRTTTGSIATDRMRDESTDRAENASASMMQDGIDEIEETTTSTGGNKARRCKGLKGAERKRCLND